jgi:hypothetical protein
VAVIPALARSSVHPSSENETDKTGAALAGVVVTVTHEETNTSIKVTTTDAAAFTAVNLIPGRISTTPASIRSFTSRENWALMFR